MSSLTDPRYQDDAKSLISMQELDPSPEDDDSSPDLESDEYMEEEEHSYTCGIAAPKLGQRVYRWDALLSGLQRYSTYPPTAFFALHFANTSLFPLVTRSVPASESYLLLTRPIYQAPGLEHLVLTVPIITHIVAGITLRNMRGSRRARLYGAETRAQRNLLSFWPRISSQARTGYIITPLIGLHVLVNRLTPAMVEGGSSGVGLGYVAHGIARSPIFWNIFYVVFASASVWHLVGGWGTWMGWRVTTARRERRSKGSLEGYLGHPINQDHAKRQRKRWWVVNGVAAVGAAFWLAGALGIVGRGGKGTGWEAQGWNDMYRQVPVIGEWL
ncbi:hypothetical protein N7492_010068 [Penicillium capsulatum]|uniref:Mitochondrial adapter protein MCP1 transmembrane domain-containing protein n=1 Tax=Penicillium capsulatum TaxID=69766 RepID=A0A9W9HKR8_9EURO|nr:hypothetical protein N7492_010068 [Penicillium capsulatum]KAJ6112577.1 hypothetical protein N7512_007901 [Penicillium capsulatum]